MDQYIGKLLDNRYELQEVIGTGGMAVVYKARCHRLNRLVAVKVLKSDLAQDAEFRRRFHDESQAVAMLSHPNIVAVYDVSRSDELNYIVMELIDGITLKQFMQKKGTPLNWREALHFTTQIIKALGHAHSRGIIHRDIKPHNIMVLRDGSVKVADFGIARLASASQSTLTQEALGSVHYISPEQARGSRIDERSDLYSAGVVLYEMTTGRLPYEGDSPVSVAIQHINSIPLSPREINPEIPEALEAITMKAMASNLPQRYESADAMLSDLEEFRKNPSINFDFVKENLFADATDEPTQVINTVRNNTEYRRRRSEEKREEERRNVWPIVVAVGAILIFLAGIGYFMWSFFLKDLLTPTQSYDVPSLVGMTVQDAQSEYGDVFNIVVGGTIESDDYEDGEVAKQEPEAGSVVKEGNLTITVTVSAESEELVMPEVTKTMEQRDIKSLLDGMGLTVKFDHDYSDEITKDYAISSDPAAGETLEKGQTVTVVISDGPETKTVTVISYVGQTLEWATKQIYEQNLMVGDIKKVYSDTVEEGFVVSQNIPATTEVVEGTAISLEVSLGPAEDGTDKTNNGNGNSNTNTDNGTNTTGSETSEGSSTNTGGTASTQSVPVDLSEYTGTVTVKVTVGGVDAFNSSVDADKNKTINAPVTGSGTQEIRIYVNDALKKQYPLDF